uniref:Uncharacterized protein n=1 Tax=Rhizophora mucronata TaxID=61149 RepID=A0A2P2N811_RHIMU
MSSRIYTLKTFRNRFFLKYLDLPFL